MFTMPNFLDTMLNNPNAQTSTDGVGGSKPAPTTASDRANNKSSYNRPASAPAIVLPPPGLLDVLTPSSQTLGIPSTYQATVRGLVGDAIGVAVQSARTSPSGPDTPPGKTDLNSPLFVGNLATQLFSGIRGAISSTAPLFGVKAGSGPIANGLAVLANSAVGIGKLEIIKKYGTAIVNAQQYAVFGSAVLESFHTKYDALPEVAGVAAEKEVMGPPFIMPKPPSPTAVGNALSLPQPIQAAQNATALQQSWQPTSVQAASATQLEPAEDIIGGSSYRYKVYLVSAMNGNDTFVFTAQPSIQVSESAAYTEFSPLHAPGQILSFKNSPARTFSISEFKLISRNALEAQDNLQNLHLLRAWTKPYFGKAQVTKPTDADVIDNSLSTPAALNARSQARNARQSGNASASADNAAAAAETAKLVRMHPNTYVKPPQTAVNDIAQTASDPQNQSIQPVAQLPNATSASSRTRVVTGRITENPVTSKLGSRASSAALAAQDPHRLSLPKSAGDGRGLQGGPTATEFNAAQIAPITPTAETAQYQGPEVINNAIGSPPEVLYLYGYSEDGSNAVEAPQNLRRIPVVVTQISFTYPNDVDYIPTLDGLPFPTVMNISIELKETKSPYEIEQFSLADYRQGKLIGW